MTIADVISNWEKKTIVVEGMNYPFVREHCILPHQNLNGEVSIQFYITYNTLFVNSQQQRICRTMTFNSNAQSNPDLNSAGDAFLLEDKLDNFTREVIEDRENLIREWRSRGDEVIDLRLCQDNTNSR